MKANSNIPRLLPMTSYGKSTVDILAPGTELGGNQPKDQVTLRGTGFAAPLVAGHAASLMAANPDLSADQVKNLVTQAWSQGRQQPTTVALIDTGVDAKHPALEGKIASNSDPAALSDNHGGGTHRAGLITGTLL